MALCKHCQEPLGLIHRCKPPTASKIEKASAEQLARQALMMHDAGYGTIDPVLRIVCEAYLDLLDKRTELKEEKTMGSKYAIEQAYHFRRTYGQADSEPYDAIITINEKGGVRALLACSFKHADLIKRALDALDAGEGPLPFTQDKEAWEALRNGIQELKQGAAEEISEAVQNVKEQVARPSVMYRAQLTQAHGQWRAQYGALVGDYKATPEEAMLSFDKLWHAQQTRTCPNCGNAQCRC